MAQSNFEERLGGGMGFEATNDPTALRNQKTEIALADLVTKIQSLVRRMDALEASRHPGARRAGEEARADALRTGSRLAAEQALVRSLQAQRDQVLESTKPLSREEEMANIEIQARADSVYQHVHRMAPPPGPFERPRGFRRRLLKELARYSSKPEYSKYNWHVLPDDALSVLEGQVFADIKSRPDAVLADVKCDEIIKREKIDPYSGQKHIEYFGRNTFIKDMQPPRRRAVLKTPERIRRLQLG